MSEEQDKPTTFKFDTPAVGITAAMIVWINNNCDKSSAEFWSAISPFFGYLIGSVVNWVVDFVRFKAMMMDARLMKDSLEKELKTPGVSRQRKKDIHSELSEINGVMKENRLKKLTFQPQRKPTES